MSLRQGAQSPGVYSPASTGSAGQFGVDLHAMATAASQVEQSRSVMTAEVNRMLDKLAGLVGSKANWDSPAAQAFRDANEQWSIAHGNLTRALDEVVTGLRSTMTQYDKTEEHTQSGIAAAVRDLPH